MTSEDGTSPLVKECEVKRRKNDPRLTKTVIRRKTTILKDSLFNHSFKLPTLFWVVKTLNSFGILIHHQFLVLLLILRSIVKNN